MKHPSNDPACGVCKFSTGETAIEYGVVYEDDLWLVRHAPAPYGVAGWLTVQSQRHTPELAAFDDREAAAVGPFLRAVGQALKAATGALRVYTVSMNESFPHFHAHLVPRYPVMAKNARGYDVFALQNAARTGEIAIDTAEIARIVAEVRATLAASPPGR